MIQPLIRRCVRSIVAARGLVTGLAAVTLLGLGCRTPTPQEHLLAADIQVADIIAAKQTEALGAAQDFSIDTPHSSSDPDAMDPQALIAERDDTPTIRIDLAGALRLASEHSRDLQRRREDLYISALDLTGTRHDFEPKFFGTGGGDVNRQSDGTVTAGADSTFSMTQAMKDGADLSVSIANDILRYSNGTPSDSATTILSFAITKPLLRGAGEQIAAEALKQAERNVIYEVRELARFQQTFAFDIAESHYRLLQQRDTVRNEYANYQNLIRARERAEALSVDRLPAFQVDQTRQDELNARNRYVLAITQYRTRLDAYKLQLGIPLGTRLLLDDADLQRLIDSGIDPVAIDESRAVTVARTRRLDFLTQIDQFDDARRDVMLAVDDLRPGLDLEGGADLQSTGAQDWWRLDPDELELSLGLRFDLPFDRLDERNAYRRSLIDLQRSLRDLQAAADDLHNDVRAASRQLDDARKRHAIQLNAVALAGKRVESANLLLQAGRAETRDLLDAQNALVRAKNDLTQVLVDYRLAELRLYRDLGAIDVTPSGISQLPINAAMGDRPPADAIDSALITPDQLFGD